MGREHGSEFLLAVGGGSVIDGTKLIAAGLLYDGDPWEIVLKGQADKTVPLGTVLTMSATGSEMNNGSVISCHETKEKFPFNGDYPLFRSSIPRPCSRCRRSRSPTAWPTPTCMCWSNI